MHPKNIFLFFLLVIFSCEVGENIGEKEARYKAVSYKSIVNRFSSLVKVLCGKVLVLRLLYDKPHN